MAFRFLSKQRVVVRLLFEIFLEAAAGFAIWILEAGERRRGIFCNEWNFFI